ncbi:MAG: lysozyme inhibitor LprI family protein [Rhodobacterales bacterium]
MIKYLFCIGCILFAPVMGKAAVGCDEPETQTEISICAYQSYKAADSDLNADYKRAMAYLKQADLDYLPEGAVPGVIVLRDAQRAWITYRDKNCAVKILAYRGGSIVPLVWANCLEEMTRARSEELRRILEGN